VTASGFGLSQTDLDRETARFGVADEQVRRDHAISHILAGISKDLRDEAMFFGGTALSRTHLVNARLSEDIDLIALGDRADIAERLTKAANAALLRTHGRLAWSPAFTVQDIEPAIIETSTGIAIRVQLLASRGYQPWPSELRDVEQRYSDAPPAKLIVPTIESFAGWKTTAWHDRGVARDLYDLWALAKDGLITREAADLFAKHGPTGTRPRKFMFANAPRETEWQASLSAQTRLEVKASGALAVVRSAWARAVDEVWD
jgi:predicted nucleotidyltransferase component of viral defense system